jgi:hypothetical protein
MTEGVALGRPVREGCHNSSGPMFKRKPNRRRGTLAACPACGADFVHPVEWRPLDKDRWWMLLRCGGCWHDREAVVSNAEAQLFDSELDVAERRMRESAHRLSQEALARQVEAFATALELDLIGAEDFAPR